MNTGEVYKILRVKTFLNINCRYFFKAFFYSNLDIEN